MKTASLFLTLALSATSVFAQPAGPLQAADNSYDLKDGLYSEITTPKGVIVCELYFKKTPMTVANYVGLAEGKLGPEPRRPYFDGKPYYRIVPGFVLQGGGPADDREDRLGYTFPDEFVPGLRHDTIGVLQMANSGPETNGSHHCIMLGPSQRLNYLHTVFGHTVRGEDVITKIELNEPMQRVKILRIGKDAEAFKADEETFKALVEKATRNPGRHRPGPDTNFYDPDGVLTNNLNLNAKLSNFEKFEGQRIVIRGFAKPPEEAEGEKLDKYLKDTAEKLKVDKSGALIVYFADQNQWHVRVATESAASFIAGPRDKDGKKPEAVAGKTLAQATEEFLAATTRPARGAGGNSTNSTQTNSTAQGNSTERGNATNSTQGNSTRGQRGRSRIEPVLDELIFRLEPAAPAVK